MIITLLDTLKYIIQSILSEYYMYILHCWALKDFAELNINVTLSASVMIIAGNTCKGTHCCILQRNMEAQWSCLYENQSLGLSTLKVVCFLSQGCFRSYNYVSHFVLPVSKFQDKCVVHFYSSYKTTKPQNHIKS